MHHRRILTACTALAILATACGGAPHFRKAQLPQLVLQPYQAPTGTAFVADSSGARGLDQVAAGDQQKRRELSDAGFISSYFALFIDPKLFSAGNRLSGQGSLADSFVLLFRSPAGASKGLHSIDRAVRRDGTNLIERPSDGLGDESFALEGTLQRGLPPGFLFAWRLGNGVFGLIAAGPTGRIDENRARALADRMAARAK